MKELFGFDFGANRLGRGGFPEEETDYVDVLLTFNGKSWKNVGFRLKGNSSLSQAWGEGIYKLPFKLNFDKFEDDYPATEDQRFYGFKKLSFSPAFRDQSLMREKITPDIFRMAGIPAAQTAFYLVYIDFGSGSKYCGIYTGVELPDDNMIAAQFGEEDGNIYKPESNFTSFTQAEFDKKNNESESNYSDVQTFITALNSSLRTSSPEQWRASVESTFNVDHFIKYLAVNNAIVNWDSYGNMAHNFYYIAIQLTN
jgi:spore coat protein CotH